MAAVGPILLLVGIALAAHTWMFLHGSQRATATITELRERLDKDAQSGNVSVTYAPVFSFKTTDGIKHTIVSDTGSNPAGYSVGQSVPIRFRAENPSKAKIDSFVQLWFMPLVFGCIGIVGSIIDLIVLHLIRKSKQTHPQRLKPLSS